MSTLTRNQKITIIIGVISILGFILSIVNSYFQFIYVSYRLQAVVTNIKYDSDTLTLSLVIINSGNRDNMILTCYPLASYNGGENSIIPVPQEPNLSLILKAGELKNLTIQAPFSKKEYYEKGLPPDEEFKLNVGARKIPIKLFFHTIDGRGYQHRTYSNIVNINIDKKGGAYWVMLPLILDLNEYSFYQSDSLSLRNFGR